MAEQWRGAVPVESAAADDRVVIRPVTVDDVDRLAELFDGLDADDRQRRFFGHYRPQREFIEQMTTVEARGGAGVVAVVVDEQGGELDLAGEASYNLLPNGDGDLAITVTPEWRGWLGAALLDSLAATAAARGVPNVEADVLTTDHAMLETLRSRGAVIMEHTGWGVVRLLVGTSSALPAWPADDGRLRVLVERPGGRWDDETAARAAGLQVLTCSGPAAHECPVLAGEPCPLAAGADAIIVAEPGDDEAWEQIVAAHASAHPGVPVYVQPAPDDETDDGPCPIVETARVVAFVARLAGEGASGPG